ncbi:hypothetical protein [Yoonia sp.]|uniref:hypothetical protein n=1 Tax=Yoonia sp. TaxID=2212373 RepID=UPI0023B47B8C
MASFEIVRMDGGYALRPLMKVQWRILVGQFLSYLIGICFAVVALGTFLVPVLFFDGALTSLRIGAAGMSGAVAAYLLWFASRGTRSEVQIDFETELIRALIPHRGGAPTLLGVYPFSAFSALLHRPSGLAGLSDLALQPKDGGSALWLARAETAEIAALQSRLERDLFARL